MLTETKKKIPVAAIAVFYLIAVTLRYITEYTSLSSNLGNPYYEILTGIGPAAGAIIASRLFRIPIPLTLQGQFRNIGIPFLIYWLLPALLLSVYTRIVTHEVSIALVLTILVYGLCEEIGWRGFLRETLKPLPKWTGILVLTVLWYVWHLNFGFDAAHLLFFGVLLLGSWGLGVVADKTKSLLVLAAFHSLNNFFPDIDTPKAVLLATLTAVWITSIIFISRAQRKASANTESGDSIT